MTMTKATARVQYEVRRGIASTGTGSVAASRVSTYWGTFGLHLGGPEGEVVAQELHDERRVLVALLVERVELRDRLVERALRQLARAVCTRAECNEMK